MIKDKKLMYLVGCCLQDIGDSMYMIRPVTMRHKNIMALSVAEGLIKDLNLKHLILTTAGVGMCYIIYQLMNEK